MRTERSAFRRGPGDGRMSFSFDCGDVAERESGIAAAARAVAAGQLVVVPTDTRRR